MAESSTAERIRALEARLSGVEARLGAVEDTEEIHRLQRTYGYYLDGNRWDDVLDLLTDDCSVEINGRGVYLGKERAAVFFHKCLQADQPEGGAGFLANHLMMQGVVHVDPSGTTAKAPYQLLIQVGEYGKFARWMGGIYENEYAKVDGKWKFSKIHWYTKFSIPYEDGWAKSALPLIPPNAEFPPDLPPSVAYEPYPGPFSRTLPFQKPGDGQVRH